MIRDETSSVRQLLRFLLALELVALVFAVFLVVVGIAARNPPLLLIAGASLVAFAASAVARALVRRGRVRTGALLAAVVATVIAAAVSPLAPYATATLVLVPVVSVGFVLPYVSGRAFAVFASGTFVSMVWIVASAVWLGDAFVVAERLEDTLAVVSMAAPGLLFFVVLLQLNQRLRSTLEAEREARRKAELGEQQAQEAIRQRDEFLTVASHELRTPLTSLQLTVQGLVGGKLSATPEDVSRALARIERQVNRLALLVVDMLTIGRIQLKQLKLDLEPCDLGDVVEDVVGRFATDLARAGSRIDMRVEHVVGTWDRNKLDQVVTNLVGNAIKFGAGKPIDIRVEGMPESARIVVMDHGIGVPPDRLAKIFDKFERAAPSTSYAGLGLGLFITKSIVEALGGTVRAESAGPDQGSAFIVELPRAARAMTSTIGAHAEWPADAAHVH